MSIISKDRILSAIERKIIRPFTPSFIHNKRGWKDLKDKYKGKRVFLIGNGPSLNKTPLYLLKGEYTLCFNRFGLMTERFCWLPSFFAMADATVCEDIIDDVKFMVDHCEKSFLISSSNHKKIESELKGKDNLLYFYHESHHFSSNLPFSHGGSTVAIDGLQILNYLGFSEIYMIGVDMNYVIHTSSVSLKKLDNGGEIIQSTADDDPNHFDPRYFGKGAKYSQPNETIMHNMLSGLDKISKWFESEGNAKVFNAGYDSKVESFERRDFRDVLGLSEEKESSLFEEVVKRYGFPSLSQFDSDACLCQSSELWDSSKQVVKMPIDNAVEIVKKVILNYVPIGPYKGYIYFIKR